ncbi:hypothetical protein EVAR_86052_1 [Eumeta japonica]|uniref:Uncharacterized protein n=1 Tax=Eumeta variegata TaxID=151549 RepID=A0A4C1UJP9_EUMVA|nr:hypothetical protein EVAR_86052_1 [Eumeta japonica]
MRCSKVQFGKRPTELAKASHYRYSGRAAVALAAAGAAAVTGALYQHYASADSGALRTPRVLYGTHAQLPRMHRIRILTTHERGRVSRGRRYTSIRADPPRSARGP